ncbi:MAG: hypothetical protein RBS46_03825 [Methyloversatilis sp.]|jgi:hypothetical protein|nr:hypothetical protein [Methyloversatilis sp.]
MSNCTTPRLRNIFRWNRCGFYKSSEVKAKREQHWADGGARYGNYLPTDHWCDEANRGLLRLNRLLLSALGIKGEAPAGQHDPIENVIHQQSLC